jgi:hypothetical protein
LATGGISLGDGLLRHKVMPTTAADTRLVDCCSTLNFHLHRVFSRHCPFGVLLFDRVLRDDKINFGLANLREAARERPLVGSAGNYVIGMPRSLLMIERYCGNSASHSLPQSGQRSVTISPPGYPSCCES